MSRDRSRTERTSEERERDRIERERRRAERSAAPASPQPDPADPLPFDEAPHPEALHQIDPEPPVAAPPEGLPHDEHEPAAAEPPPDEAAAHDGTEEAWTSEPAAHEPAGHEELPGDAPVHGTAASEAGVGEAPAHDAAAYEAPVSEAPVPEPKTPEPMTPEPAPEPMTPEPEQVAPEPLSSQPPEPEPYPHEPLHEAAPAEADPDATQGYEVPGLPPEDPAPPPRQGLPEPPPKLRARRERPIRRSLRRAAPPGGASVGAARRRGGRGRGSRLAALIALIAAAGALVLLVHFLKGSSHAKAPAAPAVVKVLIPEGKTRVQIAQIARKAGLKGSYRAAAKRSDLLNPVRYGAPKGTPDLEGFLFPATYDVNRGAPASRLVEAQLTAFQENFGSEGVSRAKALGVTAYELLTVASMIEREAQVPGDRAKIAAVIYNRLKAGMPLGIDAAIYYAVEMQKNIATYTHELTEAQLKINSPYNTRTHTGLPPTPISNPGTASIQAAAHPAHVSYLYYVAAADGCGEQVFSDTQSAFETNVAAYEAAKQQNGGHPPACKHK
ncbi:MAG: mltG [Solirubrobacterales bacterium]|nr:mltG [Solirubrobacterales bacterium]